MLVLRPRAASLVNFANQTEQASFEIQARRKRTFNDFKDQQVRILLRKIRLRLNPIPQVLWKPDRTNPALMRAKGSI